MDGHIVIGTEVDTASFDAQIDYVENQIEEIEYKLKQADMGFEVGDTSKLESQYEKLSSQLSTLRKKQADVNKQDYDKLKSNIDNVGNGIGKTIKKVSKWALALFGIRTAYNAIRSVMSTLSQYDTNIASNVEYIKYSLTSAFQPIIQFILDTVVKLLQYINYIYKAWTGKNLFKTADAFKNAQKNAKGLNKELQKTTASFDEINTISSKDKDNDIKAPNVDLTAMPEGKIPKWIDAIVDFGDWVKSNWKTIIGLLLGIGAVILLFKLFGQTTKGMIPSIAEGANAFLKFAGVALILAGFALVLHEITTLIETMSQNGITAGDVLTALGSIFLIIIGLMSSVALLGPMMTAGLVPFLAVIGALSAVLIVMSLTLPTILSAVGGFIQQTAPSLCNVLTTIGILIQNVILALGVTLPPIIKSIGNVFLIVFGEIHKIISTVGNVIISIMKETDKLVNGVLSSIVWFINQLGPAINNFVNGAITAVTKLINFVVSGIEYLINTVIVNPINKLIKTINKIPGVNIKFMDQANIPRFRPKLAKGGIINLPGKGVPVGYGRATGGERGREGVLPLTDSQQMSLLGEAIGKYVSINNVIDLNMDSRRINRILQQSNNKLAFANNG